jgi:hypothetical protein
MPRAGNAVRTGETQKNQNRQYGDKKERHHNDPLLLLTARIAGHLILRDMSRIADRS